MTRTANCLTMVSMPASMLPTASSRRPSLPIPLYLIFPHFLPIFLPGYITRVEFTGGVNYTDGPAPYYFKQLGGKVHRLAFCTEMRRERVPMDTLVDISYDRIVDGVMQSCALPSPAATAATASSGGLRRRRALLGDIITTPTQVRILVYITSFCNFSQPPSFTPEVRNAGARDPNPGPHKKGRALNPSPNSVLQKHIDSVLQKHAYLIPLQRNR